MGQRVRVQFLHKLLVALGGSVQVLRVPDEPSATDGRGRSRRPAEEEEKSSQEEEQVSAGGAGGFLSAGVLYHRHLMRFGAVRFDA